MKTQVFLDNKFESGFSVHGPRHQDGIVAFYPSSEHPAPHWGIAQWFSYKNPFGADTERLDYANGGYCYTTPTLTLDVRPENAAYDVRLELRASAEYCGYVRREGEEWPHLLIQQGGFETYTPVIGEMKSLLYQASLRLDYVENKMSAEDYNAALHGCQVHQFITVQDMVTGDFIWFGIPFFDSRQTGFGGYCAIDGGKKDASGQLILIEKSETFTQELPTKYQWIRYEQDLLPLIKKAIELARQQGIFQSATLDHMKLTSTNIGWEMFGEFNAAFSIKDMSLTAEL